MLVLDMDVRDLDGNSVKLDMGFKEGDFIEWEYFPDYFALRRAHDGKQVGPDSMVEIPQNMLDDYGIEDRHIEVGVIRNGDILFRDPDSDYTWEDLGLTPLAGMNRILALQAGQDHVSSENPFKKSIPGYRGQGSTSKPLVKRELVTITNKNPFEVAWDKRQNSSKNK